MMNIHIQTLNKRPTSRALIFPAVPHPSVSLSHLSMASEAVLKTIGTEEERDVTTSSVPTAGCTPPRRRGERGREE